MKLKIEDAEYTIIPIPPNLSPYSTRISELLQRKPQTSQEADEISCEISKYMDKLLGGTVKPKPSEGHMLQLFNAVIGLTNKVLEEAGLFRKTKQSNLEKSNRISSADSQASK